MRRAKIPGWELARLPGWTAQSRLVVYYRLGAEHWRDIARDYRHGHLRGLEPAPSARTALVHYGRVAPDSKRYYFKRYLPRNRLDPVKDLFRASRARRALASEKLLQRHGLHTPRVHCLIEEYRWGGLVFCALVTEETKDAPSVRAWLTRPELGVAENRPRRIAFLQAFAREIGTWHGSNLYHGDLRFGNVLCRQAPNGYTFVWLDNERNRHYRRGLPLAKRIRNLMQANYEPVGGVTLTDRMRFWRAYLERAGLRPERERYVLRRVVEKTQKRWRKRGWL